jgi:glutaredoxin-like protein NrdH
MSSPVKLYTLSTCGHCTATKRLLDACSVAYEFTDVDLLSDKERAAILDGLKKVNPRCTFPTIIIGDTVIIGFRENEIREALGLNGY